MKKKVFLDCGTHYGQGLKQFINMYQINQEWDVHTFEANPTTYTHFLSKNQNLLSIHNNIKHYHAAISNVDGETTINQETPPNEDDSGMGSSIIGLDKWNPWGGSLRDNFKTKAKVRCINFSKFIQDNFNQEDFLVVKLDIEGSEYDVIDSLIENNTIQYINDLYVEFHSRFFVNANEMINREQKIKNFILNQTKTQLFEWH
jgi:FkbM family methyltransferase